MSTFQPTSSPWGSIQDSSEFAPGIVKVSTASHGGILLSPERWAEFRKALPSFESWAGEGALEEDCDALAAAIVWPSLLPADLVFHAVEAYGRVGGDRAVILDYLLSESGRECRRIHQEFKDSIKGCWRVGSSMTKGNGWCVHLSRDGGEMWRLFAKYPPGWALSSEQVESLSVAA